jgi:DNA-binding CsgD family transcriptional regulator/Tfp pilus assembly protein PilF
MGGQLLEREMVLAAIADLLGQLRAGRGGALFVVGEAGLGKTSCLDQALIWADPMVRVGVGRGDVMEASLPFGVFTAALNAVDCRDLLIAPSVGAGVGDVRAARFYGVLRWLQDSPGPVLLALDDLHWADPDSLALLSFLCRRLAELPVAIVGMLRPWPAAAYELAGALAYDGHADVQRLAPLSDDAAAALLAARLGDRETGAVACTAARLCGGNPLLLEQVAASLSRRGRVEDLLGVDPLIDTEGIVLTRFAGLPSAALRVAQAASVLGTRFRPALATKVAGLNESHAQAALSALCGSGLVRAETEATAGFVHPLFGQSLYHDLAAPVRAWLHARAFTLLCEHGLEAEAVEHAIRADLVGDQAAISVVERAGRAALATGALGTATEHLHAAVQLAGDRASPALLLALGEALLLAGRPKEAIDVLERLAARAGVDPADRLSALRLLRRALLSTAGYHQASQRYAEVAALAQAYSATAVAEVAIDEAFATMFNLGPGHSLSLAKRAYELRNTAAGPLRRQATGVWGLATLLTGDATGLAACDGAAWELMSGSPELTELTAAFGPLGCFAIAALFTDRLADAEHALTTALAAADRVGAADARATNLVIKAAVAIRRGRLADALAAVDQAIDYAELMPYYRDGLAGYAKAEVLLLMGRLTECEDWYQRAETIAVSQNQRYVLTRLWHIQARRLCHAGDVDGACTLYERIEQQIIGMGIIEPCAVPWARHALLAYLASDRLEDAHRVLGWLDRSTAGLPCRWPHIAAAHGRALLAEARGELQVAEQQYQAALGLHQHVELPLEYVETLLGYGTFLRRRGQPSRARPQLAQAGQIAERCGATWLADQAHDELTVAGGRRRHTREDPTRLTAQEQRVARLAAAGHSNKAIAGQLSLSTKTVEYHLAQIYTKLGISSRRQLMTGHHDV